MVFKAEPCPLVELSMLRRTVCEVKGILIGDGRFFLLAPDGVFATDKVATIQLVVGIQFFADLKLLLHPRVQTPTVLSAPNLLGLSAVDVAGHIERQPA